MRVGGGNHSFHSSGPVGGKGGSGQKAKIGGGGSGERSNPAHGGMPPGLAKKMQDGFDPSRTPTNAQDGNSQGNVWSQPSGGGLGAILGNIFSHVFGNPGSYLGASQSSTPTAVAEGQKNQTTNPVVDLGNQAVSGSAKPLPFVSQYDPLGKDANYKNGPENCGPAVLASIAKANGLQPAGMTDAALITKEMGVAGTTGQGTTGNGMIAALQDMGMKTAATPGADMNWINGQLAQGHEVVANGDFYSVPGRVDDKQVAGHYIAVTNVANGLYSVTDPADSSVHTMTADQLAAFINNHPQGGFAISAWT